jgi:hypothetical protein
MTDERSSSRSPTLYFEILLRKTLTELERQAHRRTGGRQSVPIFDAREVVELLSDPAVLDYLAQMLASFIRIQSYTVPVRVRPASAVASVTTTWMSIALCALRQRSMKTSFAYYKRIADVCLFISGLFPEYALFDYRYPMSGQVRPLTAGAFGVVSKTTKREAPILWPRGGHGWPAS